MEHNKQKSNFIFDKLSDQLGKFLRGIILKIKSYGSELEYMVVLCENQPSFISAYPEALQLARITVDRFHHFESEAMSIIKTNRLLAKEIDYKIAVIIKSLHKTTDELHSIYFRINDYLSAEVEGVKSRGTALA